MRKMNKKEAAEHEEERARERVKNHKPDKRKRRKNLENETKQKN